VAFNVYFQIKKRNGEAASGGVLVYETTTAAQRGRKLYRDDLDQDGSVRTDWHSDWAGETIEVSCHTDGKVRGTPAYVGRVVLKPGVTYKLSAR